ncbi:MAG TPA: helix-turn-helix domain-containing protein [Patescibacteria group bacterium]|nr:helix-turn-helix domain-containing protein [Patescibacteria group bacterium]
MKQVNTNGCDHCGVSKTLKIIGSKWTMLLLHNLFEGKKRFGELERALVGISPKTLSLRLQELETEGIINKKVFAEVPLHVEYTLTEKGLSLKSIFNAMTRWGDSKSEEI